MSRSELTVGLGLDWSGGDRFQPASTARTERVAGIVPVEMLRRERTPTHLIALGRRLLPLMQQCSESSLSAKALARAFKIGETAQEEGLALRLAVIADVDAASICRRTTRRSTSRPARPLARPDRPPRPARAAHRDDQPGGRGRLPAWVVRIRPSLRRMALPPSNRRAETHAPSSGTDAARAARANCWSRVASGTPIRPASSR